MQPIFRTHVCVVLPSVNSDFDSGSGFIQFRFGGPYRSSWPPTSPLRIRGVLKLQRRELQPLRPKAVTKRRRLLPNFWVPGPRPPEHSLTRPRPPPPPPQGPLRMLHPALGQPSCRGGGRKRLQLLRQRRRRPPAQLQLPLQLQLGVWELCIAVTLPLLISQPKQSRLWSLSARMAAVGATGESKMRENPRQCLHRTSLKELCKEWDPRILDLD